MFFIFLTIFICVVYMHPTTTLTRIIHAIVSFVAMIYGALILERIVDRLDKLDDGDDNVRIGAVVSAALHRHELEQQDGDGNDKT